MGYYDEGTFDKGYGNAYTNERDDARARLAGKLADRRMQEENYIANMEHEQAMNYGDDMTRGASLGAVGGPWGALAGAIVGRLTGGISQFKERTKRGQGKGTAFANSFLNPFETVKQLPNIIKSPSAPALAASLGSAYRANAAQTADTMNYANQCTTRDQFGNETANFEFMDPDDPTAGMSGGGNFKQGASMRLSPEEWASAYNQDPRGRF